MNDKPRYEYACEKCGQRLEDCECEPGFPSLGFDPDHIYGAPTYPTTFQSQPPDPDTPDLGPCCICGERSAAVRNILMLPHPGPTPGRGWGCVQCGLPSNGATAVLCDPCLDLYQSGKQKLAYICTGYPADAEAGRTPIEEMSQDKFEHDMSFHPEATE